MKWNSPFTSALLVILWNFAPKAFSDSLASGEDVRALFEHDYTKLLGSNEAAHENRLLLPLREAHGMANPVKHPNEG